MYNVRATYEIRFRIMVVVDRYVRKWKSIIYEDGEKPARVWIVARISVDRISRVHEINRCSVRRAARVITPYARHCSSWPESSLAPCVRQPGGGRYGLYYGWGGAEEVLRVNKPARIPNKRNFFFLLFFIDVK